MLVHSILYPPIHRNLLDLYMPIFLEDASSSDMAWSFVSFKYLLKYHLWDEALWTVALSPLGVHVPFSFSTVSLLLIMFW